MSDLSVQPLSPSLSSEGAIEAGLSAGEPVASAIPRHFTIANPADGRPLIARQSLAGGSCLFTDLAQLVCPRAKDRKFLNTVGDDLMQKYFSPIPPLPRHEAWDKTYEAFSDAALGVKTEMIPENIRTDREVILFEPIAIKEEDGTITRMSDEGIRQWIKDSLQAHKDRGIPLENFDVLVRKEPQIFSRSAIDTTGKNTAVPLEGGIEFDQKEKLRIFGYHSKKIAYGFQIIPSDGRSQSTGLASHKISEIMTDPERLYQYVNPKALAQNLLGLKASDWKKPEKAGQAFLDSLWDGETQGWKAAIGHMTYLEGYVSQVFVGPPDAYGSYSDRNSPEVSTHEGLTVHMINLLDEYGRGEYTEALAELRAKLGDKMPDDEIQKIAVSLVAYGETPAVFGLANNLSLKTAMQLVAGRLILTADRPDLGISETSRDAIRLLAGLIKANLTAMPDKPVVTLAELLGTDVVKAASHFDLINVAFSEKELKRKFKKYIAPTHPEFKDQLCIVEGGLQEKEGTFHYEWKKEGASCEEGTIPTNAKDSHSASAPISPWGIVTIEKMQKKVPYCDRSMQAPVSGYGCEEK